MGFLFIKSDEHVQFVDSLGHHHASVLREHCKWWVRPVVSFAHLAGIPEIAHWAIETGVRMESVRFEPEND